MRRPRALIHDRSRVFLPRFFFVFASWGRVAHSTGIIGSERHSPKPLAGEAPINKRGRLQQAASHRSLSKQVIRGLTAAAQKRKPAQAQESQSRRLGNQMEAAI